MPWGMEPYIITKRPCVKIFYKVIKKFKMRTRVEFIVSHAKQIWPESGLLF
jgi:hypothetical protein